MTQMPVRFETADEDVWVMGAASRSATTASLAGSSRSSSRSRPSGTVPLASSATNRKGRNQGM